MPNDLKTDIQKPKEYDYDLDLNYRDDGDATSTPSINDFLKGYQAEPYAFTQWAKKNNVKVAAEEVINMHYHPEFLADYILTLWNGSDGSLQDYFEGFTLRYNNNLKKAVAEEIKKHGYTVYPVLTDDRAFYAKRVNNVLRVASATDLQTKLLTMKSLCKNSEALKLCLGEIEDIQEIGTNVSPERVSSLLDYYAEIFPEDYALELTNDLVHNKVEDKFDHYQDFGLTDDSLNNIERMLSENQDPYSAPYEGGEMGYDYVSQMRGFDGVKPEQYEISTSRASLNAKKKD